MPKTRRLIDNLWYILLIDRKKVGVHWLAAKKFEILIGSNRKVHGRTRNLKSSLWFETEAEARRYIDRAMSHLGYNASPVQIQRYADPRRPKTVRYMTEFGVVTAKQGQMILFPGETVDAK